MNADDSIRSLVDQFPPLDSNGRLVGPERAKAEEIYPKILAGGAESLAQFLALLSEESLGYKPKYAVHALATWVCRPGAEQERMLYSKALANALTGNLAVENKKFVIRQLQLIGRDEAVAALGKALGDKDLAFDAATALGNFGTAGDALLCEAYPKMEGRTRAAVLQALGRINAPKSGFDLMLAGTTDPNLDVKCAAVWALGRSGNPKAIPLILAAGDGDQKLLNQAIDACFKLAEGLAAAGKTREAKEIYQTIQSQRKEPHERHFRDAAERALTGLNRS